MQSGLNFASDESLLKFTFPYLQFSKGFDKNPVVRGAEPGATCSVRESVFDAKGAIVDGVDCHKKAVTETTRFFGFFNKREESGIPIYQKGALYKDRVLTSAYRSDVVDVVNDIRCERTPSNWTCTFGNGVVRKDCFAGNPNSIYCGNWSDQLLSEVEDIDDFQVVDDNPVYTLL